MIRSSERTAVARPEVRPAQSWQKAAEAVEGFLARVPRQARAILLCHSDADGLAAGVILKRALERRGRPETELVTTGKGQGAWHIDSLKRLEKSRPQALYVLDLGSRPQPIFPGVSTLLIDHHRPLGVPPGAVLVSSYEWQPTPCTAALAFWPGGTLADVDDLDWVAAVGIIGDLGEDATLEPLPQVTRRFGRETLREATSLINAARRSDTGDARVALEALLAAHEPADIVGGRLPQAQELAELQRAFRAALEDAKRAAPVFSGRAALVRVKSPSQVHPLLARIWSRRLPSHIVMVANEGYLPGRVNFSLRTQLEVSLLDFLEPFRSSLDATEFGYGHDRATGGSLWSSDWEWMLATLGFRYG